VYGGADLPENVAVVVGASHSADGCAKAGSGQAFAGPTMGFDEGPDDAQP